MNLVIAKCESCGAALRIDDSVTSTTCEYCGVTSLAQTSERSPSDAPKLRIAPPPPLAYTGARSPVPPVGWFVIGGLLMVGGAVIIVVGSSLGQGIIIPLLGLGAVGLGLLARRDRRLHAEAIAEVERFRREALAGRATVETISAGAGRAATLGLKIELSGQPEQHVAHEAVIPELLVPRLVQGMKLPVIVEKQRIEVQWHLV